MENVKDKILKKVPGEFFFYYEAQKIELACKVSKLVHSTTDIRAAGNETEIAVRDFFAHKLPEKYCISNGHIVDINLSCSPQLDIIIADNFKSPTLYKTLDNTEYLTFESIYSIGEIKNTWQNEHLESFIETIKLIKTQLKRNNVSSNYIEVGGKGAELDQPTTRHPYKNPIFSFLFCASSNILKFSQINDIINKTDWFYLPNVICILDKGLIININKELINNGKLSMNLYPEFIPSDEKNNYEWIFLEFDKSNNNLGSLYYSILEHLNSCVLKNPEMLIYMNKLFNISIENIEFLSQY